MRRLVLLHPMDPRGVKLGGIETHVRLVVAHHPPSTTLLLVGLDEVGDSRPGAVRRLEVEGRRVEFLPVARADPATINTAARSIRRSTTLRFALGMLRHLPAIRRAAGGARVTFEIERFEFALIPWLLRRPFVLIVHNEGTSGDRMDSLLKRYWFLHRFNERLAVALADRIVAVNAAIAKRIARVAPSAGARTTVLSVSVDTGVFAPTPFPDGDGAFHVCFAGRLDAFKDPPLMFASLARLDAMLAARPAGRFHRVAFDYVGASDPGALDPGALDPGASDPGGSDPTTVASFDVIAARTTRHGIRRAGGVAAIMGHAHAGLITSFFEGLPCYLLEMLASGRPVAAIHLPQFEPLVTDAGGILVARGPTRASSAEALAIALHALATRIAAGAMDPVAISALVRPYAVEAQMGRLFEGHDGLRRAG